MYNPCASDYRLGKLAVTCFLVKQSRRPVIAKGGILDGPGINAWAISSHRGGHFAPFYLLNLPLGALCAEKGEPT